MTDTVREILAYTMPLIWALFSLVLAMTLYRYGKYYLERKEEAATENEKQKLKKSSRLIVSGAIGIWLAVFAALQTSASSLLTRGERIKNLKERAIGTRRSAQEWSSCYKVAADACEAKGQILDKNLELLVEKLNELE
jgi:hypothetical protein